MAFPYTFQENFESGDKGNFDGTTVDGGSALTFEHSRTLAKRSDTPMPFRGAFLPQIDLADVDGSGTYFLEDTGFDHTGEATQFLRFYFYITNDLVMAASDTFDIFSIRSASLVEVNLAIRNNAGVIELNAGELSGATTRTVAISTGEWHSIELSLFYAGDGGTDGTIALFFDGVAVGSTITGITHAASTNGRFGVQNIDAGTTTGRVYFDQIVYDNTGRVYPLSKRYANPRIIYDSEQLWIGPGHLDYAALASIGGAVPADNATVRLYDTENISSDIFTPESVASYKVELGIKTNVSITRPIYFEKGCYMDLTGTDPIVQIAWADYSEVPGVQGPLTIEDGALRNYLTR